MIIKYELVETINEKHKKWLGSEKTEEMLTLKYNKKKGNYFLYLGQDSGEFVQWEVYKVK